ncbi:MAG TPA: metal-dependent hydrolase [Rhodopila sp.]
MMARSHIVIGVATWLGAAPMLHLPALDPTCLGLVVMGALLPDIDHPQSWVGRRTRPVSTAIAATFSHRGITHSAIAVIGLTMLLLHSGYRRGTVSALAVGYLSHLAADMLTPRGLRLAWPLRGTWGIPLCRTDSMTEPVVVTLVAAGVVWRLLRHHAGLGVLPARWWL